MQLRILECIFRVKCSSDWKVACLIKYEEREKRSGRYVEVCTEDERPGGSSPLSKRKEGAKLV